MALLVNKNIFIIRRDTRSRIFFDQHSKNPNS